ncbi:ABC transporter permease [Rhodococcus koreensis]|uniref:ABC transporter permease n=1 Tax=Rhodococcus koreensis TaxID=99653 RepID=UPI00197E4C8C|nr:ABC transporter permease [Rhodococcus koreensis]QSE77712.1 ABC transporter permease [Rhodococcus koreensis]
MTSVESKPAAHPQLQGDKKPLLGVVLQRYSGLVLLAALIVLFSVLLPETFPTIRTFRTLIADQAITTILSLGLLVAYRAGAFDLSVAQGLGLAVILVSWLQSSHGLSVPMATLLTVTVGALVGAANGIAIAILKVNSFIATLAMASILEAVIYGVSGGNQIVGGIPQGFLSLGQAQYFGVPVVVIYMAVVAVIVWYVTEQMPVGRRLHAVGSNVEASRLNGIRTARYIFGALVASSILASLAGVIFAAKIGSASLTAGAPYLLPAFAAIFLGSTQVHPGRANVAGTLIAIAMLATGAKGLQLLGVPIWTSSLFNGAVLLAAVSIAQIRRSKSRS